jgi:hypothetical protein
LRFFRKEVQLSNNEIAEHGQTELPDWIGQKVVRNAKQILILKVLPPAASKKSAVCGFFVKIAFCVFTVFRVVYAVLIFRLYES